MIKKLADIIAIQIKKAIPEHPASAAVLSYTISYLLNTLFIIFLSIAVSLFTGKFTEVLIILVSFALLRQVSGGKHLESSLTCILVTTLGTTALSFVSLNSEIILILNISSLLLVLFFAPSGIQKQTRISEKHFKWLKLISVIMVLISCILSNSILTATFFIQALTLIRIPKSRKEVRNLEKTSII